MQNVLACGTSLRSAAFGFCLAVTRLSAADPTVNVAWDEPTPPSPISDYAIDTTGSGTPEFPNVRLLTGSLTRRVWSKDTDNPGGIGERAGHEWRS